MRAITPAIVLTILALMIIFPPTSFRPSEPAPVASKIAADVDENVATFPIVASPVIETNSTFALHTGDGN